MEKKEQIGALLDQIESSTAEIRQLLKRRGWKNPASAENGKKGGRPKKQAPPENQ